MTPCGPMRRRGFTTPAPRITTLQRLQVLITFLALLGLSVTAAQYFTALRLSHLSTIIINVPAAQAGEEI